MSDFTKTTNFTAKDALTTGDPNKIVKGSDHDTEYDNIATASATKANKVISGTTNGIIVQTAGGDLANGTLTLPTGAVVGISDSQTLTNKSIDSDNNTITNIVDADIKAAAAIDASKIGGGGVSTTEFDYLGGVTSDIQTQLDVESIDMFSVTGTVAASALTAGLNATKITFRSATLTDGVSVLREALSAISVVVPSGATLGAVDTVESDILLLAIDNAGTIELAVVNGGGTVDFNEKALISTTAIDVTSDSADVAYSTTARSNVAFRIVGLIRSTQTTAGTWASSPSLLQGLGGNALNEASLGDLATLDFVAEDYVTPITAGSSYRYNAPDAEVSHDNTTYTQKGIYIIVPRTGTYQVSFELKNFSSGTAGKVRIYRNASTGYTGDVALGTERSTVGTSFVELTESLSLNAGDMITLYLKTGGATDVHAQNFTLESAVKQYG